MRKEEKIVLDDKEVIIKELKVSQIIKITKTFPEFEGKTMEEVFDIIKDIVPLCVEGINSEQLLDCTPSELKSLYDTFKEVNEVFFGMLDKAGITEAVVKMKDLALEGFSNSFVESSPMATGQ